MQVTVARGVLVVQSRELPCFTGQMGSPVVLVRRQTAGEVGSGGISQATQAHTHMHIWPTQTRLSGFTKKERKETN